MKIEIDMSDKEQTAFMTFFVDQFKADKDYVLALSFIYAVCADFELAPELEVDDLKELIVGFIEKEKVKFTFEINEDGLEISL